MSDPFVRGLIFLATVSVVSFIATGIVLYRYKKSKNIRG